ncbi:hypothetical protein H5410_035509 [Solanum commersonii]|uniref:Uncharacterized protein n=1 Tax=Solanum commersonii TaxID=4109 RepID=A0A9J5Y236_SOLCO|nr:hypothetical protein H5410_035509 [Solanum commersonii]
MKVQAQPKCSNALTQGVIPYSHTMVTLTLSKKNTMHAFTYKFARIFQSTFLSALSRSKSPFKNEAFYPNLIWLAGLVGPTRKPQRLAQGL